MNQDDKSEKNGHEELNRFYFRVKGGGRVAKDHRVRYNIEEGL
jgi:hypothetical protein